MERINRQVINHIKDMQQKTKQMNIVRNLKKEVDIGANGTQKYVVKKGINKGKII
jgi:hypothetical protein